MNLENVESLSAGQIGTCLKRRGRYAMPFKSHFVAPIVAERPDENLFTGKGTDAHKPERKTKRKQNKNGTTHQFTTRRAAQGNAYF